MHILDFSQEVLAHIASFCSAADHASLMYALRWRYLTKFDKENVMTFSYGNFLLKRLPVKKENHSLLNYYDLERHYFCYLKKLKCNVCKISKDYFMHLMSMLECQNNDETFVYEEQLTINLSPFQLQSEISLTTILKKDLFASFFYLKQENFINIMVSNLIILGCRIFLISVCGNFSIRKIVNELFKVLIFLMNYFKNRTHVSALYPYFKSFFIGSISNDVSIILFGLEKSEIKEINEGVISQLSCIEKIEAFSFCDFTCPEKNLQLYIFSGP